MEVERIDDPVVFLDRATPFLMSSEARHNLILGIAATIVSRPETYPDFREWLVTEEGEVAMVALRTPPFDLVPSEADEAAIASLVGAVMEESADFPGVVGNRPTVDTFVELWSAGTGGAARVQMRQGVFEATAVEVVPVAGGESAPAGPDDRAVVAEWFDAFEMEAFPGRSQEERAGARARSETMLDVRLSGAEDAGLWVSRVGGVPVSLAGFGGRTPHGIRVGPVYTPPEHRRHGYATELVAEMTKHLLTGDRRFCFLYTDLSNPTPNAIYERIGYRIVCESTEYAFVR